MSRAAPGRALNLPALASSAAGAEIKVPGEPIAVQQLLAPHDLDGSEARWLLVLSGEVIVDLALGDFRVLRQGDALAFPVGVTATLRSVSAPAVVVWHQGR